MRALVAWRGGLFLTEGEIGVLSLSSLFLSRVGVYVDLCVCIQTHTDTAHMGYLVVSPVVGMKHLEDPKNLDGVNLGVSSLQCQFSFAKEPYHALYCYFARESYY